MEVFFYILITTFIISLTAFAGAIILFLKDQLLDKVLLVAVSFASGALLGTAFLHLIPQAVEEAGADELVLFKIFLFLLFGFCAIYILENFIGWHHHHSKEHPEVSPFGYSILISDGIHNFIDGLIVAGAFIVSLPLGLATALGVAFHEIPQQIGNYGVLIYSGFKKLKALFLSFISNFPVVLGGLFGFFLSERIEESIIYILPLAAGSFIYIACSDLIPEIKFKGSLPKSLFYFFVFLAGIGLMAFLKLAEG